LVFHGIVEKFNHLFGQYRLFGEERPPKITSAAFDVRMSREHTPSSPPLDIPNYNTIFFYGVSFALGGVKSVTTNTA